MSDSSKHSGGVQPSHNQADNLIVPSEVVSRIAWDYGQAVMGFIIKEMAKYERAVDGTEERGRWKSLFDLLDYVETMQFKKAYKASTVSHIEVTDLQPSDSGTNSRQAEAQPKTPQPMTIDSEVRDILYATGYFDASTAERYEEVVSVTQAITNLIAQEANKAEQLMGEAILARERQANGQWEKVDSFIRSYQTVQKIKDPHHIFKALTADKEKA